MLRSAAVFIPAAFLLALALIGNCHGRQIVVNRWRQATNTRPIIGILSQEYYGGNDTSKNLSYIAASYVKYIEAGGARVVPIRLGLPDSSYDELLSSINGALFPGGGASITSSLYAKVGKYIFDYAKRVNDAGDHFPIWATCLGFEMLAQLLVPDQEILASCSASDIALPLNFTTDALQSRLLGNLPDDVRESLTNEPVTANYHHKCVTPQLATSSGLSDLISILSTNYDEDDLEFISTFEVIGYPFYAVQWHPEKNPWEWNTDEKNIPHSAEAVRVTQYFASFLDKEACQNSHQFASDEAESLQLIYNWAPYYSGKDGSDFEQIYKFDISA